MKRTIWLPTGTPVPGGGMAADTLAQGDSWQIVSTLNESRVLAVKPALRDRWVQDGYVQERMLEPLQTAKGLCYVFASRYGYMVSSVQAGPYPSQPSEAQLFAMSLRRMRKKLDDVSLHDALYIEQHSLVLPTYTEGREDDSQVLGRWLSGGVSISVADFDRLCELVAWMPRRGSGRVKGMSPRAAQMWSAAMRPMRAHSEKSACRRVKRVLMSPAAPLRNTAISTPSRFSMPAVKSAEASRLSGPRTVGWQGKL